MLSLSLRAACFVHSARASAPVAVLVEAIHRSASPRPKRGSARARVRSRVKEELEGVDQSVDARSVFVLGSTRKARGRLVCVCGVSRSRLH